MLIDDTRIEAQWCVDSESGEQYLIDLKSGQILAKKDGQGNWIYEKY